MRPVAKSVTDCGGLAHRTLEQVSGAVIETRSYRHQKLSENRSYRRLRIVVKRRLMDLQASDYNP